MINKNYFIPLFINIQEQRVFFSRTLTFSHLIYTTRKNKEVLTKWKMFYNSNGRCLSKWIYRNTLSLLHWILFRSTQSLKNKERLVQRRKIPYLWEKAYFRKLIYLQMLSVAMSNILTNTFYWLTQVMNIFYIDLAILKKHIFFHSGFLRKQLSY